ncbi:MAG: hypothetical protein HYV97_18705 [Bdellovibrio sp.]|nr:hypothetical protein [Bdellovibrio sp.]
MKLLTILILKKLRLWRIISLATLILIVVPTFLKDEYARPMIAFREGVIHKALKVGSTIQSKLIEVTTNGGK